MRATGRPDNQPARKTRNARTSASVANLGQTSGAARVVAASNSHDYAPRAAQDRQSCRQVGRLLLVHLLGGLGGGGQIGGFPFLPK